MTSVWRFAAISLALSAFVMVAAVMMIRAARWQARIPLELHEARKAVDQFGGEQGLTRRHQALVELKQRLELEQKAKSSDSATFSRRLEELLAVHRLSVAESTSWQAASELASEEATAFERTFSGSGRYTDLLAFVRVIESWPDRPEVRALTIVPQAQGRVAFSLEIAVVRLAQKES